MLFTIALILLSCFTYPQPCGCTDVHANNYDKNAVLNDGNCKYDKVYIKPLKSWQLVNYLHETSGLIKWDDYLITHNDNDDNHLYALDLKGQIKRIFNLGNIKNIEWEDITQDSIYIYIGDFGNNAHGNRKNLRILRLEKKQLFSKFIQIDTISFSYSNQNDFSPQQANTTNFDCEAFIATADSLYLFTKQWELQKTSIYALPKTPGNYIAQYKSTWNIKGLVTGATYVAEKQMVALCGYSKKLQPFIYLLYDFKNNDFFSGNKRKFNISSRFHQIEGIATSDGYTYYLTNERFIKNPVIYVYQQLHYVDLNPYFRGIE